MPRRILSGTICKATNKKTVVVEVERTFKNQTMSWKVHFSHMSDILSEICV